MRSARARACANVALVKYWGKRDERLVLPQTGSISVALDALWTETSVRFDDGPGEDRIEVEGTLATGGDHARAVRVLDLVRGRAGFRGPAEVSSHGTIPLGAGLASSAAGFAAMALAASAALGLELTERELSVLARQGSGSACRSIPGGFAEWLRGERPDGGDSYAVRLHGPQHWDLGIVIAVVERGRKPVSSRQGMRQATESSIFYAAYRASVQRELHEVRRAIAERSLSHLGEAAERSAMRMHATTLGADPPFSYFLPPTLAALSAVHRLRAEGTPAYATVDAGPNVKVLCAASDALRVAEQLRGVPGVGAVIVSGPGPAATVRPE